VYIHIVTPKVHVSTTFTTFIHFCDIQKKKKKMKENDFFFFFEKFGYAWGTHAEAGAEAEKNFRVD
jgi:hypothetical protein